MPRELWLVVALLALIALVAALPTVDPTVLLAWGTRATVAGLLLGIPPALVYHWRLAYVLRARGELPRRWYWNPTALHTRLVNSESNYVLRPFYVGGIGFLITCIGFLVIGIAVLRAAR